jgi:hypothetical protein
MADSLRSADYVGYRDAAAAILSRHDGPEATEAFGLVDVFEGDDLGPAYAFLEAQGFAAAITPALSLLALAEPAATPPLLMAMPFGRGEHVAVAGLHDAATVVADQPGSGLIAIGDAQPVASGGSHADDYLTLYDVKAVSGEVLVAESDMAARRPQILARTRLGASAEILGVCERLVEDAVTHVKARRQFGQALSEFQAIQHLLAWAATELHQLRCMFDIAVHTHAGAEADPAQAEMVKALAGRVLHTITQTVIQVSGAISFTWEYSVNRLHHRGLLLDQLAGSSAELVTAIGERTRTERRLDPLVELAALYPSAPSE